MKNILKKSIKIEHEIMGDDSKEITREKIVNAVSSNLYAVVCVISNELREMELEPLTISEIMKGIDKAIECLEEGE